jgi:hypothetical protein
MALIPTMRLWEYELRTIRLGLRNILVTERAGPQG